MMWGRGVRVAGAQKDDSDFGSAELNRKDWTLASSRQTLWIQSEMKTSTN